MISMIIYTDHCGISHDGSWTCFFFAVRQLKAPIKQASKQEQDLISFTVPFITANNSAGLQLQQLDCVWSLDACSTEKDRSMGMVTYTDMVQGVRRWSHGVGTYCQARRAW